MKYFYKFFQISIIILVLGNSFFILNYETLFGIQNKDAVIYLYSLLFTIFILYLIDNFFQKPIKEIEFMIKSFLVGKKIKKITAKKIMNPSIDYSYKFFNKTIDTLRNIKDEFIHGKEIKGEVGLAKEIQGKILTKKLASIPSLTTILSSKPAGEIGGDSFDIIEQGDNYYIYVGDATGHGVGAGFIMIMVNALVSGFSKVFVSGADILAKTNEILKPRVKANLLMSLLLVRWNEKEKRLYMTGAGHEYLMVYKQKLKKTFRVKSGGVALGMVKNISKVLKEVEIKVEPGDIIVLYSDGITEAINRPKRDGTEILFGEDRLEKAINESPNIPQKNYKSARSVYNNITIQLSKFMGYSHTQLDDVTLGVLQYNTEDYKPEEDFAPEIDTTLITEWSWK